MSPKNRFPFWDLANRHRPSVTRRKLEGRKADRAAQVERLLELEPRVLMAIFTVTNTDDSGAGSLRDAIASSNATPGFDIVEFGIPGTGVQTISPASELPIITDPMAIDGTTQAGYVGSPLIEISGTMAGAAHGLILLTNGSVVRGVAINAFGGSAILINGGSGNVVQSNYLGTDPTGTLARGGYNDATFPHAGVAVLGASTGNTIEENLISGNQGFGVLLYGPDVNANRVAGNLIGTDINGTQRLDNKVHGVALSAGASNNLIGTNGDGVDDLAERNVISGNSFSGVILEGAGTSNNLVAGNFIGTDVTGTFPLANGVGSTYQAGVVVTDDAHNNLIGTNADGLADADERNLISGNFEFGVLISFGAANNLVAGNHVGLNAAGTAAIPNLEGVRLDEYSRGNTVGGALSAAGNVISGNTSHGIHLMDRSHSSTLLGNLIGLDAPTHMVAVPNGGAGIHAGRSANNRIGSGTAGGGNTIAGNAGPGVEVVDGSSGSVLWLTGETGTNDAYFSRDAIGDASTVAGAPVVGGFGFGFDGLSQSLEVTDSPALRPQILSVEAWVYPTTTGASRVILTKAGAGGSGQVGYALHQGPDDRFRFVLGAVDVNTQLTSSTVLTANTWYHLVGTYDGSTMNLYVDNTLEASVAYSGPIDSTQPLEIAKDHDGTQRFAGRLDEIAIYDRALTAEEIQDQMTSDGASVRGVNRIQGNRIGLNALGVAVPNQAGVSVYGAANVLVGGSQASDGNVISGNGSMGVAIRGDTSRNVAVFGNRIGTDPTGMVPVGNGGPGLYLSNAISSVQVGGPSPESGNLIAGNGDDGIYGSGPISDLTIRRNTIGTSLSGDDLGHGGYGIFLDSDVVGATIGGANANEGNLVANSGQAGIRVLAPAVILGNSTRDNLGLGIDTGTRGVSDAGPSFGRIGYSSLGSVISGTLQVSASGLYRVEFFASDAPDASGYGEGSLFLGFQEIFASSDTTFELNSSPYVDLIGKFLTATVTFKDAGLASTGEYGLAKLFPILVSNTLDSGPFSLRQAIHDANNLAIVFKPISFDIPGSGVQTISPATDLPAITADNVLIDGYTQPGSSVNTDLLGSDAVLKIFLNGQGSPFSNGLVLDSGSNTIRGLAIGGFSGSSVSAAVWVTGLGNLIVGNQLGIDDPALGNQPNQIGVRILGGGELNTVGGLAVADRNVIANNLRAGIQIETDGNLVVGNLIGTNLAGTAAIANGTGISILSARNTIGGTVTGARNVISGSTNDGVFLSGGVATNNLVAGNLIGTKADGTGYRFNMVSRYTFDSHFDDVLGNNPIVGSDLNSLVPGLVGQGLTLDRYGYIDIAPSPTLDLQRFTIDAFVRPDGPTDLNNDLYGSTLIIKSTSTNEVSIRVGWSPSTQRFNTAFGDLVTDFRESTNTFPAGSFYHVAVSYDGSTFKLYVNGVIETQFVVARTIVYDNNYTWSIGSSPAQYRANAHTWNGVIDDLTFSSGALPDAAIQAISDSGFLGRDRNLLLLGNGQNGVNLESSASFNTIGGLTAEARNVISGNLRGVRITTDDNTIAGNSIGTDATGAIEVSNALNGIYVGGTRNTIGGTATGAGNVVSGNGLPSVDDPVLGMAFERYGIFVEDGAASHTVIQGNLVGTDASGLVAIPNAAGGIAVKNTAEVTIGGTASGARNVISGNLGHAGIFVTDTLAASDQLLIQGNLIGTGVDGQTRLANFNSGITVQLSSGFTIGGLAPSARNVISGAEGNAVTISDSSNLAVENNMIGLNQTGTSSTPLNHSVFNAGIGIALSYSTGVTIGGTAAGAGNIVSGGSQTGVYVLGGVSNLIGGNLIGTDVTGTLAFPNEDLSLPSLSKGGVTLDQTTGNTVGGTATGARNVISGNSNSSGVQLYDADNNTILGNFIGTDITGTVALGNGLGVWLYNASSGNTIGGTSTGAGNVISGNSLDGIYMTGAGTTGNVVVGNDVGVNKDGQGMIAGTVSWFQAEGNANDAIGGHNGTLLNGVGFAPGEVGQAFSFDGMDDEISIPNSPSLELANGDFTIDAWINTTNDNSGYQILLNSYGGTPVFQLGLHQNRAYFELRSSGGHVLIEAPFSQNDGLWHHIAGVRSGSSFGLFVDGLLAASATDAGVGYFATGAANVQIGGFLGSYLYKGLIDELGLFNRGLTASEVASIFAAGSSGKTKGLANGSSGVAILTGADGNTIGGTVSGARNVISGNVAQGVILLSDHNVVAGNHIGTDLTGGFAIGNSFNGVYVGGAGNTIGGDSADARNVISGNVEAGVKVTGPGATGNVVAGNFLGTDVSGTARLSNRYIGLVINNGASSNTIGGLTSGARNLISGNLIAGVSVDVGANSNVLVGNFIGTDVTGLLPLGNTFRGVYVAGFGTTIGGTAAGARNVISANGDDSLGYDNGVGIEVAGQGAVVQGNYLGPDATGLGYFPARQPTGIVYAGGANSSTIGGTAAGAGNVIASDGNGSRFAVYLNGVTATLGEFVIQGNLIGVGIDGITRLPTYGGIIFNGGGSGLVIGGSVASARNVIGAGIAMEGSGDNLLIQNNLIGLTADGSATVPGGYLGISLFLDNSTIGGTTPGTGNVISGFGLAGIALSGSSNLVAGNKLGTDETGTIALINGYGVRLLSGSGNTIGGLTPGAGNLISGNSVSGIQLLNASVSNTLVVGNFIGSDMTGQLPLGNTVAGVEITGGSSYNTIGGASAEARNLISGNDANVFIHGTTTASNVVLGNFLGTSIDGDRPLGSGTYGSTYGVTIREGSPSNTVGGTVPGAGNLISGNGYGVDISGLGGDGNLVIGNRIGTDPTGTLAVPNLNGVVLSASARNITIGGTTPGATNLISGNNGYGVWITGDVTGTTTLNTVVGNLIGTDRLGVSALPNATAGVFLDRTQGNTVGGTAAGARNVVSGNHFYGVLLRGAAGNVVAGNFLGTDVSGLAPLGNLNGVQIAQDASDNTIGGSAEGAWNLISGNAGMGVAIEALAGGNVIAGNFIGTDVTGGKALGNASFGIEVLGGSQTLGGTVAGAGNVISGNGDAGVRLFSVANLIAGNLIGTDASGYVAVGNAQGGVAIESAGNTLGGTAFAARNVISGNPVGGVLLNSGARQNLILGNLIGTNVIGTLAVGNAGDGIRISGALATGNTIGGARNVISGNSGDGIRIAGPGTSQTTVVGNFLGTDVFGTGRMGNGASGIAIGDGSTSNRIGDTTPGSGNRIAFNGQAGAPLTSAGVRTAGGGQATIVGNSFRNNVGLAIDVGSDGLTPSDLTLDAFSTDGLSNSTVEGSATNLVPGETYHVDFYTVINADPTGHGEGYAYAGRRAIVGDPSGLTPFTAVLPVALNGHVVLTGTITDASGLTREFSLNFGDNQAPFAIAGADVVTTEGTPVAFDGAQSSDPDGDALTYEWDFGDGTTGTGPSPQHTYNAGGLYSVMLVVSDGFGGISSDTLLVQVANVAPTFRPVSLAAPTVVTGPSAYASSVAVVGDLLAVASPGQRSVQLLSAASGAVVATLDDPTGNPLSGFGSVIAAVGYDLAVSAPGEDNGKGRVYLFDALPLSPTFGQLLRTLSAPVAPGATDVRFGAGLGSVGTRLIVGAPGLLRTIAGVGTIVSGGAFAYDANPTSTAFGSLVLSIANPSSTANDDFGVAISALGANLLIGAPLADAGGPDSGAAWVIDGTSGLPIGVPLVNPNVADGQVHQFGRSVASVDGVIIVGAREASFNSAQGIGAVYLFGSTSRSLLATLTSPDAGLGRFGASLATTANTLLVGSPRSSLGSGDSGAAYEFDVAPGAPTFGTLRLAVQRPEPTHGDRFGESVAYLDQDVLVGAPGSPGSSGRAFFFPASAQVGLSASSIFETASGFHSVIVSGEVSDPGGDDVHTVVIDWKDGPGGTSNLQTLILPAGVVRFSASHRYAQDDRDSRLVTVQAFDSLDAGSEAVELDVTVKNVAPTLAQITLSSPTLTEGGNVFLSGRLADPGELDGHTVTVDWGDGSPILQFTLDAGLTNFDGATDTLLQHTYRDNPALSPFLYTVTVTVADELDLGSDGRNLTVENFAPSLSSLAVDAIDILPGTPEIDLDEGDTINLTGQIFDLGIDDTHTLVIDWGDGSGNETVTLAGGAAIDPGSPQAYTFSIPHRYLNNRADESISTYTITVTQLLDKDGAEAEAVGSMAVTVRNVLPTVAIIGDPAVVQVAGTVALKADVIEPGPIDQLNLIYAWTLTRPDGSQSTGTQPTFAFTQGLDNTQGEDFNFPVYRVSVRVTDDRGNTYVQSAVIPGTDAGDQIDLSPAIVGSVDQVVVLGYLGNDTVGTGSLQIPLYFDGGDGTDSFSGGDGDDTIATGHGDDTVQGGNGNNYFFITIGSSPTVENDGTDPAALNTLDFSRTGWGITVDLGEGKSGVEQTVDGVNKLTLIGTFQNLVATPFDDVIFGNTANNLIRSGGGNDLLYGGSGNDTVYSGSTPSTPQTPSGNTISGGTGSDLIFGGAGDDVLGLGTFNGTIEDGVFTLDGTYDPQSEDGTIVGGTGSQLLYGGSGRDTITGSTGQNNTVAGGGGPDIIYGGAGTSTLAAGTFEDGGVYVPLPGQSTIYGGSGGTLIYGGSGNNTLVSGSSGGDGTPATTIVGGPGGDLIYGGSGRDSIGTGGGNNTVIGGAGTEIIYGGTGRDSIVGGSSTGGGGTIVGGGGPDIIYGGSGRDTIGAGTIDPTGEFVPAPGASTLVGGSGGTLIYGGLDGSTIISGSGTPTVPGGSGNTILGGPGPDLIYGGAGNDSIRGGAGNNTILGGSGSEVIYGGANNDSIIGGSRPGGGSTIVGGGGGDIIYGGQGRDLLAAGTFSESGEFLPSADNAVLVAGSGGNTLMGGTGPNLLYGGSGNDTIISGSKTGGQTTVIGGAGGDIIYGGRGNDTIDGGIGNDSVVGGPGSQLLYGGGGNDTITSGSTGGTPTTQTTVMGGSGRDVIYGGLGNDSLEGGADDDTLFAGSGDQYLGGGLGNDLVAGGTLAPDGSLIPAPGRNTLMGGGGNDLVYAGSGSSTLGAGTSSPGGDYTPGAGGSTLIGGSGTDIIFGGLGNDFLLGGSIASLLNGFGGNDTLYAGGGNTTIRGGSGNDTLRGGFGGDVLYGDEGINTAIESADLDYAISDSEILGTDAQGQTAIQTALENIQRILITGGDSANILDGRNFSGSMTLRGGSGDDTLFGATIPGAYGPNVLEGGRGDDVLWAGTVDTTFVFSGDELGFDTIRRGSVIGRNRLDFGGLATGVSLDIGQGGIQELSPGGLKIALPDGETIQDVVGSSFNDFIVGNRLSNTLIGGGGNDQLVGRGTGNTLVGGNMQAVYLDFDSRGGPGVHEYTQVERDRIQARMTVIYAAFSYTFTQVRPAGEFYTTIFFNDPNLYGLEGGRADAIDWRNLNRSDDVSVNVNNLLGRDGQPPADSDNYVALSVTIASHELGHNAGLKHADSYGPIGGGIYARVNPLSYVDIAVEVSPGVFDILGYPGPTLADETPFHIMASGDSVRVSLFDAVGPTYFGAREAIKLAYSQQGSPTAESALAHNTLADAQAIRLAPVSVPNTNERGGEVGLAYNVTAANVIGRIDLDPVTGKAESDFYHFQATAGTVLNVDIFSASLSRSRIANPIDSIVRVYQVDPATGVPALVPYYANLSPGRVAVNDNGFQGQDSSLLDLILPADGTYIVEVDTYNPTDGLDGDTGDYELFLYTFARGNGASTGDSLFAGSGNDVIIGDTNGGVVRGTPGSDVNLPGSGSTSYLTNVPPQFVASGADRTVTQNSPVSLTGSFFEADEADVNTVLWSVTADNGEVIPGSTNRSFSFQPTKPGTYTVTFAVGDGQAVVTSQTVVTVTNVPASYVPPASPPALDEGATATVPLGSFSDPGPNDGPWKVIVDWGDGTEPEVFFATQPGAIARPHLYAQNRPGDAAYTIRVSVTDIHGDTPGPDGSGSFPLVVRNAAPAVAVGGDQDFLVPGTLQRLGSFTDVDGDGPWTATVDYGDGTGVQDISATIDPTLRTFALDHVYAQAGTFIVTVRVTDRELAQGSASYRVTASAPFGVASVGPVDRYSKVSVSSVLVQFTAPIAGSSFTAQDLALTRNGVPVALSGVAITPVQGQPTMYTVALGTLAAAEGEYTLTVNAATILSPEGGSGSGSAQATWTTDRTGPTSRVVPFTSRQTTATFPVSMTFADTGSGAGSYSLYVSTNNGPFVLVPGLADVPLAPGQTADTKMFTATSNRTYNFRVEARDLAGNVEVKVGTSTNAATSTGDVAAPVSQVTAVDGSGQTFVIDYSGSDTGSTTGIQSFDLFVQMTPEGQPASITEKIGTFAANPAVGGVSAGQAIYAAKADGTSYTYRFFTQARDFAGNVEVLPSQPDATATTTFAASPNLAAIGFQVSRGLRTRSFVRYLDVLFNQAETAATPVISSLWNDITLTRYPTNSGVVPNPADGKAVPLNSGMFSALDNKLTIDFGAGGLGGTPTSNSMDGYYELSMKIGTTFTKAYFYRLLGDVDGNQTVELTPPSGSPPGTTTDYVLTSTMLGLASPAGQPTVYLNSDVDGDGKVTQTDRNIINVNRGRTVTKGLKFTTPKFGLA